MTEIRKQRPESRDPLLRRQEPERGELLKRGGQEHRDEASTAAPEAGRTGFRAATHRGPLGWLQVLGPGLITGASDDDPSGIGTYAQVGSQFGYGLLWTALFTFPLMAAVQEVCARIALETGVGLGTALRRKFPTWLVGGCIAGLVIANVINLGADLAAVAAGFELLSRGLLKEIWLVVTKVGSVGDLVMLVVISALVLAVILIAGRTCRTKPLPRRTEEVGSVT